MSSSPGRGKISREILKAANPLTGYPVDLGVLVLEGFKKQKVCNGDSWNLRDRH